MCQDIGGRLASLNTVQEKEDVFSVLWNRSDFVFFLGLKSAAYGWPFLYVSNLSLSVSVCLSVCLSVSPSSLSLLCFDHI